MDSEIIKKILKDDSEKLIIIEDGKPKFVVMTYAHYSKMTGKDIDKNFEMKFEDLFPRADLIKEKLTVERDEKMDEADKNWQSKELSLDDLPIA